MKYLKTYEQNIYSTYDAGKGQPEIGDYIILKFPDTLKKGSHLYFMENNIGKITDSTRNMFKINYYRDIPTFEQDFWWASINIIRKFSKNKEELEAILLADKYSL